MPWVGLFRVYPLKELTGRLLWYDGKEGGNIGQVVHAFSLPFLSSTPDLGEESVTVSMRA